MAETTTLLPNATYSNTFRPQPPGVPPPAHTRINSGVSTPTYGSYLYANLVPKSIDMGLEATGANKAVSQLLVRALVQAQFDPLDDAEFIYSLYLNGSLYETITLYDIYPDIPVLLSRTLPLPDMEITSVRMLLTANISVDIPQAWVYEVDIVATWDYIQKTTVCVTASFGTERSVAGSIPEC